MAFLRSLIRHNLDKKRGPAFPANFRIPQQELLRLAAVGRRAKSTAATGALVQDRTAAPVGSSSPKDPLDVTFEDAKAAFKSKTTWELLRAYIVYTLCSFETLVENNMRVS